VPQALKDAHPGVKFSVRTHTYASVRVYWTDGPTRRQVEATTRLYESATFDGMTDMKSYKSTLLSTEDGAEVVHFGADSVYCARTISDDFHIKLEKEIEDFTGESYNPSKAYHVAVPGTNWDGPELCHDRHGTTRGIDLLRLLACSRPAPVKGKR
jgi:hypothetical protein